MSGRLSWADGEYAEQQIRVPIIGDDAVESPEQFSLTINNVQGGAGLGTTTAFVDIAADGGPFGQFSFTYSLYFVSEVGPATVDVWRNYYASGAVSVNVTPVSGTATADDDFDATPVTRSWADGEGGQKRRTSRLLTTRWMNRANRLRCS